MTENENIDNENVKSKYQNIFAHDFFFGGLNLFKRDKFNTKANLERPPFPIIVDDPLTTDVIYNMNKADFGIISFFTIIG